MYIYEHNIHIRVPHDSSNHHPVSPQLLLGTIHIRTSCNRIKADRKININHKYIPPPTISFEMVHTSRKKKYITPLVSAPLRAATYIQPVHHHHHLPPPPNIYIYADRKRKIYHPFFPPQAW